MVHGRRWRGSLRPAHMQVGLSAASLHSSAAGLSAPGQAAHAHNATSISGTPLCPMQTIHSWAQEYCKR